MHPLAFEHLFIQIGILPVGQVEDGVLRDLRGQLKKIFSKAEITLTKKTPLPGKAYDPLRHQYYSTRILRHISRTVEKAGDGKILGVTSVDLYVPQLNFVFGEAQCPGKVAIVSLHRLRPTFYGDSSDEDLFLTRITKEAVHELGHTFGLLHCENPKCIMSFSNSILDTDKKTSFCTKCTKLVNDRK